MSRAWTWRQAILKSKLPATTKHVLLVVSCHMNDVGEGCYPSTKSLAEKASLSERSVCTHLDEAEKLGWLKVQRHGFGGQKWARNEYEAVWPKGTESGAEVDEGTEPDDMKALNVLPKGTEPPSAYIDNIPNTSPTNQSKAAVVSNPDFDDFWQAYPNKVGKPVAIKAFLKAKPDMAALMDGLAKWKASPGWQKDRGRFIPHPTTFLNQRRWEDMPVEQSLPQSESEKRNQEFWANFDNQQKQIA
ncbi:MAG: helix-turn-helix domain-containing protein [Rhizobiaceae bacterium]